MCIIVAKARMRHLVKKSTYCVTLWLCSFVRSCVCVCECVTGIDYETRQIRAHCIMCSGQALMEQYTVTACFLLCLETTKEMAQVAEG